MRIAEVVDLPTAPFQAIEVLPMRWRRIPWINVVAGIYLVFSPFIFSITYGTPTWHHWMWSSIAGGIVALAISLATMSHSRRLGGVSWAWISWINVGVGLFTVTMPFVFGGYSAAVMISHGGALVVIVPMVLVSYVGAGVLLATSSFIYWLMNFAARPVSAR